MHGPFPGAWEDDEYFDGDRDGEGVLVTEIVGQGVAMTTLEMIMGFPPPPRLHFVSALHGGTCNTRKKRFTPTS